MDIYGAKIDKKIGTAKQFGGKVCSGGVFFVAFPGAVVF
jgi:hypothetical protein